MAQSFDLLLFGRRKIAATTGSSPTHEALSKVRFRIIRQVFNNRRLVYRNRVEANRQNLVLSTIESEHKREQSIQRLKKENILTDLKQKKSVVDSGLVILPSYVPIGITEPKDFYRFGVRIHSAGPHVRSRARDIRSDLTRSNRDSNQSRAKSATVHPQSYTSPFQTFGHHDVDSEDDDEGMPLSNSRVTSNKSSNARLPSAIVNAEPAQNPSELPMDNTDAKTSSMPSVNHRVTWPVRLKVFALQDEDEARQEFLAWRTEHRITKKKESLKPHFDFEVERQYLASIRRQKEIEAFVTPDIIEEHFIHDPIFAKRYRQLKLAVRSGKVPNYDPNDHEIKTTMTKSKIERARTALITAKQSQLKSFYRNQQIMNDAILSKRIETFLKHLAKFNEEQEQ
ncbi:unnamed protein product [Rotaria magnacalcarata]|uniref:Uncharacterized protein n=2 Tax=Rotaria magnacalcarata TaxID=392030 RepID=A0A815Q9H2_9BILA|nr:unnamed protein product [Rotaria magnacalcarata]CAF1460157.1 unnamed protein product [Rotaria magnacalcarata]CAF2070400.1 unnamed protein product [Rotaria magnacalcarata]CAF4490645.1 unnamed protein product [Rotaria magnacalcarata]